MKLTTGILLAFLIPTLSFSQAKNYFTASFGPEFPKGLETSLSARISFGGVLGDNVLLGAGIGVTKLSGEPGLILPLVLNLQVSGDMNKPVFPLVIFQPGYGIHSHTERITQQLVVKTTGGLTYYAGAGVGFRSADKTKVTLTGGYSHYTYTTEKVKTYYKGPSIRIAVIIM